MFDRIPLSPRDHRLLARAAEMLALPQRVCRRRDCRRRGRCAWLFRDTLEPCCLANLDAGQRRLFDEFVALSRNVRDYGDLRSKVFFASACRETRALQDAALEVARPLLSGVALARFRAFAAFRAKMPPARCEGGEPPFPKA